MYREILTAMIALLRSAHPPGSSSQPSTPAALDTIELTGFSAFVSLNEKPADTWIAELYGQYLNNPEVIELGKALRDTLLASWAQRGAPVDAEDLYSIAVSIANDSGLALILCYHVCRAFSRGGWAIYWQRCKHWREETGIAGTPDGATMRPHPFTPEDWDYTDGDNNFYRPIKTGSNAQELIEFPATVNSPARKSIFYLIFNINQFGQQDPNDWYHYFLMAAMAYYAAKGRVTVNEESYTNIKHEITWIWLRSLITGIQRASSLPIVHYRNLGPLEAAWYWCNATSFLEGSLFGGGQENILRETKCQFDGMKFGLLKAGMTLSFPHLLHFWIPKHAGLLENLMTMIFRAHPVDAALLAWENEDSSYSNADFWEIIKEVNDPVVYEFKMRLQDPGPVGASHCVLHGISGMKMDVHPISLLI